MKRWRIGILRLGRTWSLAAGILAGLLPGAAESAPRTFHKDVAPILYARCAGCHRPGEAAPFPLLGFSDAAKRAKQIADMTARRIMPPWLPVPGHGEFANSRRLSDSEIAVLREWAEQGAPEGNAADAPPPPKFSEGWHLGEPDLVVRMDEPYLLAAEGKDVYRNVAIPIPVAARRFVKAVELRPGNTRVVHHASIYIDRTGQCRRLAQRERPAGFDGMELPESATVVAGQMLNWEPGKKPEAAGDGLAWVLEPGSDLVLQFHLHPSGKPEHVQAQAGFYFTDQAPTNVPYLLRLPQWQIDIPAGASAHVVRNAFELPVDVQVLRVSPHAHYLGRELLGYAILPGGRKEWLLKIEDWDFNWQGDYRYASQVFLPKGSMLHMEVTFDNSAANPRNPSQPPKRVRQGPQTTDEMAQLTFQVLARNEADRRQLAGAHVKALTLDAVAHNQSLLKENPSLVEAHAKLGQAFLPLGRHEDAARHLREAIRLDPARDKPHYDLGTLLLIQGRLAEARAEFETVLKLNPGDYQAHGNLGAIYQREGSAFLAEHHFREALRLNPRDAAAARALEALRQASGRP